MAERILAIGDIHGCDIAFLALLKGLAIRRQDTVVILGDVVDRGPGSRQVIDRILQLQDECQLIFIQGNHEEMMLSGLTDEQMAQGWLLYGGQATLASYGGDRGLVPQTHIDLLKAGRSYWETDTEIFVHANLDPALPLDQQEVDRVRWTHLTGFELPHPSGKRVVCGHTPQRSGRPRVVPGWVCIDTFVCGGSWLTCLDVTTNEYCQSNLVGQLRFGRIDKK
ncbi:MAG: serine/threonine protein phosphatase [Planctomycetes bacterium]|nr:serine/threonine protein phosphatase [Planctomycetota bacterium]